MNRSEDPSIPSPALVSGEHPSKPVVVNCAHVTQKGGFFESHTQDMLQWLHFSATDPLNIPLVGRNANLQRLSACHRAARAAKLHAAGIVVTHDPRISFVVQHFLKLYGYRGPHLAFSFNYPWLPTGPKGVLHRWGFKGIDKFVVFSTIERKLYHEYFNIPLELLEFMHWGVAPPRIDSPDRPCVDGDYLCALGGNSRDYRTLIEAAKRLPEVRIVLVVRPENVVGIDIPPNVRVMTNIPTGQAINVLAFSRFMALPLDGANVPCGHVTLVSAMHLGKAIAITRSAGVADYVRDGDNALMFSAKSVDETTEILRRMWNDPSLCSRLGEAGRLFAAEYCTESRTLKAFTKILGQLGVRLTDPLN